MELSKSQLDTLVIAKKAYVNARIRVEEANKELAHKFNKLKEVSGSSGSPEKVMADCDAIMAAEFQRRHENGDL